MAIGSYDSAALRLIDQKVRDYIRVNAEHLAEGNAHVGNDASATAMNYMSNVGYVRALRDVLDMCGAVEAELNKA